MPELAEVEFSRRLWDPGLGHKIVAVDISRPTVRVFRGLATGDLVSALQGKKLVASQASGKQLLFEFSGGVWLGIHLGMSGELRCEVAPDFAPAKHDHLVLRQAERALVFADHRQFGRVRLDRGSDPPGWWIALPPSVASREFTLALMSEFLARRGRAPLKAVLLMQERFPGIGNWMADEILWRARLHPAIRAGDLAAAAVRQLWESARRVCRDATRIISPDWSYPKSWLFQHRWESGGRCPRCGTALDRAQIGGRTTAWCPRCQPSPRKRPGTGKRGPVKP